MSLTSPNSPHEGSWKGASARTLATWSCNLRRAASECLDSRLCSSDIISKRVGLLEGEAEGGGGERETLESGLEGEKVMVGSEMKPCLIIVETWRDFRTLSAAIGKKRNEARRRMMVQAEAMEEPEEREREQVEG